MKKTFLISHFSFLICFLISHFSFLISSMPCFAQNGSLAGTPVYGSEEGQMLTTRNGSFGYQPVPQPRVFKEHDLITVLVNESFLYSNNSNLQRQRKVKGKMGLTDWIKFPGLGKLPEPIDTEPPKIGGEIDHQSRAKGQLDNKEKLTFKIQCHVAWVMDNGNLHIEGQDQKLIGEETMSIYFSGDIRPEDVKPDNTIESNKVAAQFIKHIPSGNIFDSTKRSYGQRFIDRWSPF